MRQLQSLVGRANIVAVDRAAGEQWTDDGGDCCGGWQEPADRPPPAPSLCDERRGRATEERQLRLLGVLARGLMMKLSRDVGETAVLARADDRKCVVYTDVVESAASVRCAVEVGAPRPYYASAAGSRRSCLQGRKLGSELPGQHAIARHYGANHGQPRPAAGNFERCPVQRHLAEHREDYRRRSGALRRQSFPVMASFSAFSRSARLQARHVACGDKYRAAVKQTAAEISRTRRGVIEN